MVKLLTALLTGSLVAYCALPTLAGDAASNARSADFYKLAETFNRSVCGDVLASLNEPYTLPAPAEAPDRDRAPGHLLLQSDMQVHWSRIVGEKGEYLDFAKVKLQPDGQPQTVYRFPFTLNKTTADMIATAPVAPVNLDNYSSLTPSQASRKITAIEGSPLSLLVPGPSTTPQWKKDAPPHIGSPSLLFIDFIAFSGGTYMLAIPASEALELYQRSSTAKSGRKQDRIDVYLLRVASETDIPMVCHFEHGGKHRVQTRATKRRR